jgi:RNA polymerase sigma-70 factor (ECF subfamily)
MYALLENTMLVELLCKDDENAFTELYNRYWQKLFAIAYNRLKEAETAEDIVHDVFAGLWANRGRIRIESLENYLATATKYLVLAKIKRKINERSFAASAGSAPVIEMTVESSVHYKQILELVYQEVETLPEKCRLIFKCSRNDGLTTKQIAGRLHLSPKTVENQLTKALNRLKPLGRTFFYCLLLFLR